MKEKIAAGLVALGLAGPAEAGFATVEGFVNNDKILVDIKAGGQIGEDTNVGLFVRDRVSLNYDGTTANFLIAQGSIGQAGVPVRAHVSMSMPGVDPKLEAGLHYVTRNDNGSLLVSLSSRAALPYHGELFVSANYSVGVGTGDLVFEVENFNWVDKVTEGTNFSGTVRGHVGYRPNKHVTFGLAGEVDYKHQQSSGWQGAARGGAFVRLGF